MIVIRDTLAIILLLVVMIRLSPQLTLLIGIVGPVIALLVSAMSRAFRRYSSRIQHSMGDVTKITEQSLHGHRVVKIFEGQEHERRQFDEVNVRNFRFNVRLVAVQALGDALTQYSSRSASRRSCIGRSRTSMRRRSSASSRRWACCSRR